VKTHEYTREGLLVGWVVDHHDCGLLSEGVVEKVRPVEGGPEWFFRGKGMLGLGNPVEECPACGEVLPMTAEETLEREVQAIQREEVRELLKTKWWRS